MPCFRPIQAYQPFDGGVLSFVEKKDCRSIKIPCGQCIGCRAIRRDSWALRCLLEAKMHDSSWFATLTYRDECLPSYGSLHYPHVQACWDAVRHKLGAFRYFVAGEYGDQFGRPHYHALLFGLDLPDVMQVNHVNSRYPIFESASLSKCWPHGQIYLGTVSFESARYCASYTVKKVNGRLADDHYSKVDLCTGEIVCVEREFAHMSLKPGIGATWFDKYWQEVYASGHDGVFVQDQKKRAPRYFKERLARVSEDAARVLTEVEYRDYQRAMRGALDSTPERLAVREQCEIARVKFNAER